MPPEELTVERALPADADLLLAIHEDAARWLWDRGIHQWEPGKYPRSVIEEWIAGGEAYVARCGGEPVGMVMLQGADDFMWPDAPPDALYVHGLRVLRAHAGQGLGRAILRWAEGEADARGKAFLRLDVMADNSTIRAYYEAAGFVHVRDVHDKPWPGSLYAKRVEAGQVATPTSSYAVVRAGYSDVDAVADILEEAARWLWERGIQQWRPGALTMDCVVSQVHSGETFLALDAGNPAGTLRLQWRDEATWGPMPDDAGYVHSLAVRRRYAGQGLGRALLGWAEARVRASGRAFLRLDCMARNPGLRAYYEREGFVARTDLPADQWTALYEKRVGGA